MKRTVFAKIAAVVMAIFTMLTLSLSVTACDTPDHETDTLQQFEASDEGTSSEEEPFEKFVRKFVDVMSTMADFVVKPALLPDRSDWEKFLMSDV